MKHSKSDRCLTPSHPDTLCLGYIGIQEGSKKVVYELLLFGEKQAQILYNGLKCLTDKTLKN